MKRNIYTTLLSVVDKARKSSKSKIFKVALLLIVVLTTGSAKSQVSEGLHFDGTNDYVDITGFVVPQSYTKMAWINPSSVAGFPNIISGANTALFINNGRLAAGHNPGFNQVIHPTAGSITAGTWTHIAATYDAGTGILSIYQNGVLVASAAAPTVVETLNRLGTFAGGNYFAGVMDEVRFYSRALTQAEIAATMSCALTGDEPFLLAYYNFEDGLANQPNPGQITLTDQQDECIKDNGTLFNFALTGSTSNWVAPGATITTNCAATYPNINVTGNAVCIESGDITPSPVDSTDFGDYGTGPVTRTFTITNSGSATLTIDDVVISGADAADFTITTMPATTVAPGGSTTFTVTFSPVGPLLTARTATITVENDDADEANYTFNVTGFNRGRGETLSFDGINDSVYLPVYISGSYTKEAWINTADLSGFPNIISGDSTALFLNNGRLAAGHFSGFAQILDPVAIIANTWTHIAVTYDSATTTLRLFKDGVQVGINTTTPSRNDTLALGTFLNANFYEGLMDEVRIWDIARTGAEIAANMNCGLTGDEFYLLAYYKFNQGAANGNNQGETTLADSTDRCVPLNGTLHNFAMVGGTSNFVAPGIALSGTCTGIFENISITGNNACISFGDMAPTPSDATDFGTNTINTPTIQVFTITNTGSEDLNITLPLTITGTGAAAFTITDQPDALIPVGGSSTFTVVFQSALPGTFNAEVNILNSDADETGLFFAVQGTADLVLPVTLLNFTGALKGSSVKLDWKTSSETNNYGFEVLRSNGSQSAWEKIGFVAGTNKATGSNYTLTDYAPLKGINIYKLRQLDFDARASFSNSVNVNNNDKAIIITAYPNPFMQSVNIIFNDAQLLNTEAKVRSVTGTTVATIRLHSYRQQVNLGNLAPGMYYISLTNGEVIRLIKQ